METENHFKLISKRIRTKRIELEFSQEYMAERLNISQNIYSKNERYIEGVPLKRILKIAVILNLTLAQLLEM